MSLSDMLCFNLVVQQFAMSSEDLWSPIPMFGSPNLTDSRLQVHCIISCYPDLSNKTNGHQSLDP